MTKIFKKIKCEKCTREITSHNFKKHFKSCIGVIKTNKNEYIKLDNEFKCKFCDFHTKTMQSVTSHIWYNHTEEGKENIFKKKNYKELRLNYKIATLKNGNHRSWNKGLTKETDDRVRKNSIAVSNVTKGRPGRLHTDETKKKLSQIMSINNKGGKCKWFEVAGQKVQGTWERDIALLFDRLKIKWQKLKTNNHTFKYTMNGKIRSYTPDFFLPDLNLYLEIKGRWWGNDKEKMDLIFSTYPDINILLIQKEEFKKLTTKKF